jgi:hypothetical protein
MAAVAKKKNQTENSLIGQTLDPSLDSLKH